MAIPERNSGDGFLNMSSAASSTVTSPRKKRGFDDDSDSYLSSAYQSYSTSAVSSPWTSPLKSKLGDLSFSSACSSEARDSNPQAKRHGSMPAVQLFSNPVPLPSLASQLAALAAQSVDYPDDDMEADEVKAVTEADELLGEETDHLADSISDTITTLVTDKDNHKLRSALHTSFSEADTKLFSVCQTAVALATEAETQFLTSELKQYFKNQIIKALAENDFVKVEQLLILEIKNPSWIKSVFSEVILECPESSRATCTEIQRKYAIFDRLQAAVSTQSFNDVYAIFQDATKAGICSELDSSVVKLKSEWLHTTVACVKTLSYLVAFDLNCFENILKATAAYSESTLKSILDKTYAFVQQKLEFTVISSRLASIIERAEVMKKNLPEKKAISDVELYRIAFYIEQKLSVESSEPMYVHKRDSKLARTIVIDQNSRRYIVLSQKNGLYKAEGIDKIVTNATCFDLTGRVTKLARAVNIIDDRDQSEAYTEATTMRMHAELEQSISNDFLLSVLHTSKSNFSKASVFTPLYDGDLSRYCTFAKSSSGIKLPDDQILSIYQKTERELGKLHAKGYCHADIKEGNILLNSSGELKIIDYSFSYNDGSAVKHEVLEESYGTLCNTPPEYLSSSRAPWTVADGKKHDAYAFGCVLYRLLFGQEVPWISYIESYFAEIERAKESVDPSRYMSLIQTDYTKFCQEVQACQEPVRRQLLDSCAHLLHPDPKWRKTIA